MEIFFFLSSGLFLGWSLGANDAANVFGTAVGTRMVRFKTAAVVCSVFIVLGATFSGAGAAHTLGRLGAINALPGAFTVALASALTTFWMTRAKLPVSTSQAIVGAIIGWNFYASAVTDTTSLTRIVSTWVICPVLSGGIAVFLYILVRWLVHLRKPHLLQLDALTRLGLLVAGAFGSYSLGANNIANVMGVFVPESPFSDLVLFGFLTVTGVQQLFLLGSVAIGVGVLTYSRKVMATVGGGLARISPVPALIIVMAQSLTLFIFASEGLELFLVSHGLPAFPLVPVSSSQAVVGAIVGISLFKGAGIRYRVLGGISLGWVATPLVAMATAFILLFVVDNVFDQTVHRTQEFRLDEAVAAEWQRRGLTDPVLEDFVGYTFTNPVTLQSRLKRQTDLQPQEIELVIELARYGRWAIRPEALAGEVGRDWLDQEQWAGLHSRRGWTFEHAWQLEQALAETTPRWRMRPDGPANKTWNRELREKLDYMLHVFSRWDVTH